MSDKRKTPGSHVTRGLIYCQCRRLPVDPRRGGGAVWTHLDLVIDCRCLSHRRPSCPSINPRSRVAFSFEQWNWVRCVLLLGAHHHCTSFQSCNTET